MYFLGKEGMNSLMRYIVTHSTVAAGILAELSSQLLGMWTL